MFILHWLKTRKEEPGGVLLSVADFCLQPVTLGVRASPSLRPGGYALTLRTGFSTCSPDGQNILELEAEPDGEPSLD